MDDYQKIRGEIERISQKMIDDCQNKLSRACDRNRYNQISSRKVVCTLASKDLNKFKDQRVIGKNYASFEKTYVNRKDNRLNVGGIPINEGFTCEASPDIFLYPVHKISCDKYQNYEKDPENTWDYFKYRVLQTQDGKEIWDPRYDPIHVMFEVRSK